MQRRIIPETFNEAQKRFLNDLFDDIFGDIVELEADPTTAGEELEVNQIGLNTVNKKLFINLLGTTYLIATLTPQ